MHTDSLLDHYEPHAKSRQVFSEKYYARYFVKMLSFCLQRQKVTINTKLYPNLSKTRDFSDKNLILQSKLK